MLSREKKGHPLAETTCCERFLKRKRKFHPCQSLSMEKTFSGGRKGGRALLKRILYLTHYLFSDWPKKCRTSTFQKSFFIRTTRIWNLLITRLDLDNVTFENFKSVLYGYYSRALAINYDPDSPRSFKSICLKCNTARFLDQEISCCMWLKLLILYLFIFWVRSNCL